MKTTQELPLAVIPAELEKAVAETGLSAETAQSVCRSFAPHYVNATALLEEAKSIAVNAPIAAKAMRLKLKVIRCAAEATRISLNADALKMSRSINAINALIEKRIATEEDRLDKIEKAEAIAAAEKKSALKLERETLLAPYGVPTFDLSALSVADWNTHLENAKAGHEARIAAAAKAEADRIAKEKADAEAKAKREAELAAERERMRVENERLAKIAAEERAARAEAEKVAAAKLKKAKEAAKKEREAAAELQRVENEKHAKAHAEYLEKARIERERVETEARKEREAREKIEAEQLRQRAAESMRIAAEREAARKAAAAPDREKINTLAAAVRALPLPELSTAEEVSARIEVQVEKFAQWLESEGQKL